MSIVDLSHLQETAPNSTVVKLHDREIALRPLMMIPAEHDAELLQFMEALANSPFGKGGKKANASLSMKQIGDLMPHVNTMIRIAAPTSEDGERLSRLPLGARLEIVMSYASEQDMGKLLPSAS